MLMRRVRGGEMRKSAKLMKFNANANAFQRKRLHFNSRLFIVIADDYFHISSRPALGWDEVTFMMRNLVDCGSC